MKNLFISKVLLIKIIFVLFLFLFFFGSLQERKHLEEKGLCLMLSAFAITV